MITKGTGWKKMNRRRMTENNRHETKEEKQRKGGRKQAWKDKTLKEVEKAREKEWEQEKRGSEEKNAIEVREKNEWSTGRKVWKARRVENGVENNTNRENKVENIKQRGWSGCKERKEWEKRIKSSKIVGKDSGKEGKWEQKKSK